MSQILASQLFQVLLNLLFALNSRIQRRTKGPKSTLLTKSIPPVNLISRNHYKLVITCFLKQKALQGQIMCLLRQRKVRTVSQANQERTFKFSHQPLISPSHHLSISPSHQLLISLNHHPSISPSHQPRISLNHQNLKSVPQAQAQALVRIQTAIQTFIR